MYLGTMPCGSLGWKPLLVVSFSLPRVRDLLGPPSWEDLSVFWDSLNPGFLDLEKTHQNTCTWQKGDEG